MAMSRPPSSVSRSSGLVNTAHQPGMALGLAVLAAVAAHAGPGLAARRRWRISSVPH
jgi:hypothetical protein